MEKLIEKFSELEVNKVIKIQKLFRQKKTTININEGKENEELKKENEELKKENEELKKEIKVYRKLFKTNPNKVIIKEIKGIICHKGEPQGTHECSKCREVKSNDNFTYYNQRVDKNGYLIRTNALCSDCKKEINKETKETLDKESKEGNIPSKPKAGDTCNNCNRQWTGNWHRDHDAKKHKFREWLCGDCNMAKHDHRHNKS